MAVSMLAKAKKILAGRLPENWQAAVITDFLEKKHGRQTQKRPG